MRVKIFQAEKPHSLQDMINDWLSEEVNQRIEIMHIQQSGFTYGAPGGGMSRSDGDTVVSIWYQIKD